MSDFSCGSHDEDGIVVVEVIGDVDLAASDSLWKEISAQLDRSDTVVADCGGITFLDSMGLQVLLRALDRAAAANTRFALIKPAEAVRRVLELTGLTGVLPVLEDLAAARDRWR